MGRENVIQGDLDHPTGAGHKAGVQARVRSAASERRRRSILDAALACFLEHGVAATPHLPAGTPRSLAADPLQALWFGPAQHFARLWLAGLAPSGLARAGRLLPEAAWQALRGR